MIHVKGHINSLKKQGERLNDVQVKTIAIRLHREFDGLFLSVVSGQLWCRPCCSYVGSVKGVVTQRCKGKEDLRKVQIKIPGSDRDTKIIEYITTTRTLSKKTLLFCVCV